MDLMSTSDQDAIRTSVRSFVENELPIERVLSVVESAPAEAAAIWRAAGELGFFGLGLPAEAGGAGYALTEEMVLFEELGRALAPGPWLGSVLAAHALASAAETAGARASAAADLVALRDRLLAGELRIAWVDRSGHALASDLRDGRLSATRLQVADATAADGFLVLAADGAWLVPPGAAGVEIEPHASMDPTRPVARVSFNGSPCVRVDSPNRPIERLRREAVALACAEAVGGIDRTVERSVAYAKVRTQFDRPIGSFQAVKHRCADMAVRAEMARSAATYAVVAVRDDAGDADFQVSVAKILCGGAFVQNAADNVQNHGGMGFTWECDAHLFVKRARSFDLAFGSRTRQLDRLVAAFRAA